MKSQEEAVLESIHLTDEELDENELSAGIGRVSPEEAHAEELRRIAEEREWEEEERLEREEAAAWADSDGGRYQLAIETQLRLCGVADPIVPDYMVVTYDTLNSDPGFDRYVFTFKHYNEAVRTLRVTCDGKFHGLEQEVLVQLLVRDTTEEVYRKEHWSLAQALDNINALYAIADWDALWG